MLQTVLDFVFPRRSLTGEEGEFVTAEEFSLLQSFPVLEEAHVLRGRGIQWLDAVRAGSSYHHCPLLKKAIHTFKFGRIPGLAGHLASLIAINLPSQIPEGAVLCPVPLHWSRHHLRGFNQSELLAGELSARTQLPVRFLLSRVRATGFQSHRSRSERLVSLQDAFVCREQSMPSSVILIDDLATTGATLDACARVLKERGVRHVEGWVVAHG
jgi:ComF family protein